MLEFATKTELAVSDTFPVTALASNKNAFPLVCVVIVRNSATLACATFKFATRVVLVTVNGAVPVATLEVNVLAITPVAPKLPTLALPVAFNVPDILTPAPVTTKTLAFPTALMFTFPLADGMFTFEFPLLIEAELILIEVNDKLPDPSVVKY